MLWSLSFSGLRAMLLILISKIREFFILNSLWEFFPLWDLWAWNEVGSEVELYVNQVLKHAFIWSCAVNVSLTTDYMTNTVCQLESNDCKQCKTCKDFSHLMIILLTLSLHSNISKPFFFPSHHLVFPHIAFSLVPWNTLHLHSEGLGCDPVF